MAIILYSSGVIEEYKPSKLTFSNEEILHIFKEETYVRTKRLLQIPNTWCVWGESFKVLDSNYNRLGSEIIEKYIYTPLLIIHDSELNPSWKVTDDILQKNYNSFKTELFTFIDSVALEILNVDKQNSENPENIIILNTVGPTKDKRMIFDFDPKSQNDIFYSDQIFEPFAQKIYSYLDVNYKNKKPFTIFENENMVIIVKDENVEYFIDKLINSYTKNESYEICSKLTNIKNNWNTVKEAQPLKKKRGRPKKIKTKI
jgi:hypothetical protein